MLEERDVRFAVSRARQTRRLVAVTKAEAKVTRARARIARLSRQMSRYVTDRRRAV